MDFILNELSKNRTLIDTGIHPILRMGFNRYVYAAGFTFSFAIMYFLINKVVYYLTENDHIHDLCVQKYKLKNRDKKFRKIKPDTSNIAELSKEEDSVKSDEKEIEQNFLINEEIKYNLWFYRFSCMECISCTLCSPILLFVLFNFDAFHNNVFTFVSWSNYVLLAMIMGHYLVDLNEVLSYGYIGRSKDLLLHHLLAIMTFGYSILSLQNFPFITLVLFMEFNSFFNRSNLILKYHDVKKVNFWFNMSNIGNFLTMIFVRIVILIRLPCYFIEFRHMIPGFIFYFIFISVVLFGMKYLAWKSLRYMIFNDLIYVKMFFLNNFKFC